MIVRKSLHALIWIALAGCAPVAAPQRPAYITDADKAAYDTCDQQYNVCMETGPQFETNANSQWYNEYQIKQVGGWQISCKNHLKSCYDRIAPKP